MKISTISSFDHKSGTSIEVPFLGGAKYAVLVPGACCTTCSFACCCTCAAIAQ